MYGLLFVDINAFFASVEQQLRPELRGRPVAVIPVWAQTTCCIAASYEAKAFGVKTGMAVHEACRLCPRIVFVEARPPLYVEFHHKILEAAEKCLHISAVHSIDEFSCELMGGEREPKNAEALARQIKAAIAREAGESIRCSIGIAPNTWLAKVGSDMQKPDGLVMLRSEDLPQALFALELMDLPGIGRRMFNRLRMHGIQSVEQLCAMNEPQLSAVWGSRIHGRQWWDRLHAVEMEHQATRRRSVGHSRVLSPDLRNDVGARQMLLAMLHKAAARLRKLGCCAQLIEVAVTRLDAPSWAAHRRIPPSQDTLTLLRVAVQLWDHRPKGTPLKVGVVLGDLTPLAQTTAPLFEEPQRLLRLGRAMDVINGKFGRHALYFAAMHGAQEHVPTRIAFTHIPDSL